MPPRPAGAHKGSFGRALLIGGSRGMSGAIALAGMAALRSGAGLVRLAVPRPSQSVVAALEPSYMTADLPADDEGRITLAAYAQIMDLAAGCTALACGPGLGRSAELTRLVARLYRRVPQPMVCDADALNALAEEQDALGSPGGPRLLTPHPGEFARLLQTATKEVVDRRDDLARQSAQRWGTVVVVKGNATCITDGHRLARNTTGNPGMATGGTGDVLTGVITALLCQGLDAFAAARLGVYVHGAAGDAAAAQLGQSGMIASDVVAYLPHAMRALEQRNG